MTSLIANKVYENYSCRSRKTNKLRLPFLRSSSTDVTILEFRGGESVSTQKRMEAPTNLREICDLNFDCLFFKFNSRVTRLRLFSAIMTYGSQGLLTFRDTWEKLRLDRDPRFCSQRKVLPFGENVSCF